MKKTLMAILFGSALVLSACGGGGEEGGSGGNGGGDTGGDSGGTSGEVDVAAAEKAFQQNCASCHGADLSGGAGPSLQEVGAKYSKEEILNIIKNGKGSMPAGQATGEDAELIASWLATKK
ncbi:cytochrome c551 [Thalassobacillus pellis]|uniref:cytochrome c551 n=1 Tax=Thalassobacillus pellis TaxID=748008 RepID=UPI00196134BB|nr:cytochrome c [Thalassobacillus pellis]MBM7551416.1 cytochrome c551 [Thalassobacillus pellis]